MAIVVNVASLKSEEGLRGEVLRLTASLSKLKEDTSRHEHLARLKAEDGGLMEGPRAQYNTIWSFKDGKSKLENELGVFRQQVSQLQERVKAPEGDKERAAQEVNKFKGETEGLVKGVIEGVEERVQKFLGEIERLA